MAKKRLRIANLLRPHKTFLVLAFVAVLGEAATDLLEPREDYEEARLAQQSLENVEMALKARSLKAKLAPVVQVIVAVGTCLVLWYGVNLVLTEQLTAGSLLVFLLYLGKLYKPMRDLSKMTDTMSKAAVGYERIHEVIETEDEIRNLPSARVAPNLMGDIQFDNVYFAYDSGYDALTDINLEVEPGQLAALVGPTGAGKTTIAGLIGRFYDPQKRYCEDRRQGCAQLQTEIAASTDELRFAGDTSFQSANLAEHCLRETGGLTSGDPKGCRVS